MINTTSLQAIAASTAGPNQRFRKPHPAYNFSRIPATIATVLAGHPDAEALPGDCWQPIGRSADTIILIFVDALGWTFFEQYGEHPFLKRVARDGLVSPLTTQFPSTTAAHVTTIHSGQPAGRHGIIEWFYFEPKLDAVITPLRFSFAGDADRATLGRVNIRTSQYLPAATFYQRLAKDEVASTVVQDEAYTPSPYSDHLFRGATVFPCQNAATGLDTLAGLVAHQPGRKRYFFNYIDDIDGVGHHQGPDSADFAKEIRHTLDQLETFVNRLALLGGRVWLMLTADHGQVQLDPTQTVYLNHEIPGIERFLRLTLRGEPIRFGGSCRDLFFYVKSQRLDEFQAALTMTLDGRAAVWRTRDMIEEGFFGDADPEVLLPRVGDLAVLPFEGEAIYWYDAQRFVMRHRGAHGGLLPAEMETYLAILPL
jgi:hypothetical protein